MVFGFWSRYLDGGGGGVGGYFHIRYSLVAFLNFLRLPS